MRYVLITARNDAGAIQDVYSVPGDKLSWSFWWGAIRDREKLKGYEPEFTIGWEK